MCGNPADPGTVTGQPGRTWKGSVARKSESARARLKMYMLVAVFILVYLRPEQIEDRRTITSCPYLTLVGKRPGLMSQEEEQLLRWNFHKPLLFLILPPLFLLHSSPPPPSSIALFFPLLFLLPPLFLLFPPYFPSPPRLLSPLTCF